MSKNSQAIRFTMAAGMYLLLMWGYIVLPTAQWFAAFLALIMCSMLVFWVSESFADVSIVSESQRLTRLQAPRQGRFGVTMLDWESQAAVPESAALVSPSGLDASYVRLESLKSELKLQYAQFGRDQSLINSKGLGSWHGHRSPRGH
ncbi:hypothetical protein [Granulosicoccus antarcticus]|uniref:Uncharacterized protein n=1 Tax=Granulosicoccus antarcticus IMCC3135 TaxID=1192854 RepID=A0A2Z2P076_9GAMM|nr:hypothetical protein [Granulosicoccus antarcticus]ASJ75458.1 hypothetical protein IMCC3135_27015 [Granulosicoccus antarcticus IMCC3135]